MSKIDTFINKAEKLFHYKYHDKMDRFIFRFGKWFIVLATPFLHKMWWYQWWDKPVLWLWIFIAITVLFCLFFCLIDTYKFIKWSAKYLKTFRGIGIKLFNLNANSWDGYGIELFCFSVSYKGGLCTSSITRDLFFIKFKTNHDRKGKILELRAGLFFMYCKLLSIVIIPPKDRCDNCGDYCETKEFYENGVAYCCDICRDAKLDLEDEFEHNN